MSEPKDDHDDETGQSTTRQDARAGDAKAELFEAIDHFKNAASILFDRATSDPALRTATKEAGRVVKKIGDAAEPIAAELTKELGRLTRDVMSVVEGTTRRRSKEKRRQSEGDEEE